MNPVIGFIFVPVGFLFIVFGVKVSSLKKEETLFGIKSSTLKTERGTYTLKPIIAGLFILLIGCYFIFKYFGIDLN